MLSSNGRQDSAGGAIDMPGNTPQRLPGQVAVVTGAGRGFGRAIALKLAAEGAAVALLARCSVGVERVEQE